MSATMAYMGLTAFTGFMKARSQYKAGYMRAAAHQFNADISNRNYEFSLIEANQKKFIDDLQIAKFLEKQKEVLDQVDMANRSNGWIATTGTPLKVAMATAMDMEEDIQMAEYNRRIAQRKIKEQGIQDKLQGQLQGIYGRNAISAGKAEATGSLLSTATNIAMIKAYG